MTGVEKNYLAIGIFYLCDGDMNTKIVRDSKIFSSRSNFTVGDMITMNMMVAKSELTKSN